MSNDTASSTFNKPLSVVVLPEAPIFTGPPPNVNNPVVVANTFTGVDAVALVISPPLTIKSPAVVSVSPTYTFLATDNPPSVCNEPSVVVVASVVSSTIIRPDVFILPQTILAFEPESTTSLVIIAVVLNINPSALLL